MYTGLPLMPCATPGLGEPGAFEPRENQVAARALDVAEHAEDLHLEILKLGALEDRSADADHARPDSRQPASAVWSAGSGNAERAADSPRAAATVA